MIEAIISNIVNFVVGVLATWIYTTHRKQKSTNEALKSGLQSLLRDRLIQAYNHYIEQGWIPIYAKDSLVACYKSYEELGENKVITDIMEQLNSLPNYEVKK